MRLVVVVACLAVGACHARKAESDAPTFRAGTLSVLPLRGHFVFSASVASGLSCKCAPADADAAAIRPACKASVTADTLTVANNAERAGNFYVWCEPAK